MAPLKFTELTTDPGQTELVLRIIKIPLLSIGSNLSPTVSFPRQEIDALTMVRGPTSQARAEESREDARAAFSRGGNNRVEFRMNVSSEAT